MEWIISLNYKAMKIYDIKIKDVVRRKVNDISNYIYRFSFSKDIVQKNYNMIFKEIFSLKIFPERFPKFNENYRVLTIKKRYRVLYKIEKDTIVVSSIFSSYENYDEESIENNYF